MFGYPLIAAASNLVRKKNKPLSRPIHDGDFQMVICFQDDLEPTRIFEELKEFKPLLLRDGGSRDYSSLVGHHYFDDGKNLGKWARMKQAAKLEKCTWLIFTDASAKTPASEIRKLMASASSETGLVSCRYLLKGKDAYQKAAGLYWRFEGLIKGFQDRRGTVTTAHGALFAVRRTLLVSAPDQVVNDDLSLALHSLREGFENHYSDAQASESHSESTGHDLRRRIRIAHSNWVEMARYRFLIGKRGAFDLIGHKTCRMLATLVFGGKFLFVAFRGEWPALLGVGILYGLIPALRFPLNTQIAGIVGFFRWVVGAKVNWK